MNCAECGCPTDGKLNVSKVGTMCAACFEMLVAVLTPYFKQLHIEYRQRIKQLAAEDD